MFAAAVRSPARDDDYARVDNAAAVSATYFHGFRGYAADLRRRLRSRDSLRLTRVERAGVELLAFERDHPLVRLAALGLDHDQRPLIGGGHDRLTAERTHELACLEKHGLIIHPTGGLVQWGEPRTSLPMDQPQTGARTPA